MALNQKAYDSYDSYDRDERETSNIRYYQTQQKQKRHTSNASQQYNMFRMTDEEKSLNKEVARELSDLISVVERDNHLKRALVETYRMAKAQQQDFIAYRTKVKSVIITLCLLNILTGGALFYFIYFM